MRMFFNTCQRALPVVSPEKNGRDEDEPHIVPLCPPGKRLTFLHIYTWNLHCGVTCMA